MVGEIRDDANALVPRSTNVTVAATLATTLVRPVGFVPPFLAAIGVLPARSGRRMATTASGR